jgi:hypothetical protein
MFSIESSAGAQLLTVRYSGHVSFAEMAPCLVEIERHLRRLRPGFHMLTDLTGLVGMDAACAAPLGQLMDLFSRRGVSAIHRVSPDPQKDLGFALMSPFHYGREVRIMAHADTAEALQSLGSPAPPQKAS